MHGRREKRCKGGARASRSDAASQSTISCRINSTIFFNFTLWDEPARDRIAFYDRHNFMFSSCIKLISVFMPRLLILDMARNCAISIARIMIAFVLLSFYGCGNSTIYPSPRGYNINKPYVTRLPSMLDEISGIVYYPKDKSLFAIHDEHGWLYKIFTDNRHDIEKWKYSPGADFEDVALVDSTFFALKSNGMIVAFRFAKPDSPLVKNIKLPSKEKNEFETLYLDSVRQQLMMVCKNCALDKKTTSVYAFDYKQMKFLDSPVFRIDEKSIEKKLGDKISKFKPSAGNINPKTGELFLISSVNKLLVITDRDGKVIDVFQLDPRYFKQPEGLTFTPSGDLLISNESAKVGSANIMLFKYNESPRR
jgi:uncharacterized protein YjiK